MLTADNILDNIPDDILVGIGRGTDNGNVEKSAQYFGDRVNIYDNGAELISDLKSGAIDAAVRGDMSSSLLLPIIKSAFGLNDVDRVVLLQPVGGKLFFMAPVGIDEGWTVSQKHDLCTGSIGLMERMGMGKRIAVMSGGRNDDRGRNSTVDRTIKDAGELIRILKSEGYDAYSAEILIESAAKEADLIIAPDGISGNLIFRTLHFMGGAKALGAPVINIDRVFVDTSRVKVDFRDSIALAMRLARY